MAPAFNLIDEEFVPCRMRDGTTRELSLQQVFDRAREIREIHASSPHTNAALMRFLLAFLHACVWKDRDEDSLRAQWLAMWQARTLPLDRIREYSQNHYDRFDLFSERFPFYQTATLEMNEASPLSRLAMEEQLPSALFQHAENPQWQNPSLALAARLLISAQSFVLGFGRSSKARLNGEEIEPPYSADGIALRGLTLWLSGDDLLETLLLNLVPEDAKEKDEPIWQNDHPAALRDQMVKGQRVTQPPKGTMDRLTWQSRLIRLLPEVSEDGVVSVPRIYFTQGRSLEGWSFDPMKTYRKTKDGFLPLALNEHKAIWRDAHALLQDRKQNKKDAEAPLAAAIHFVSNFELDELQKDHSPVYNLNIVGMAAEPGKAANFRLWRQERMPLPATLLSDPNLVYSVRDANNDAQEIADLLGESTRQLCRFYLSGASHKAHGEDVKKLAADIDPRVSYWARLEPHFHAFLLALADDEREHALDEWNAIIEREARLAFEASSHALGYNRRAIAARAQTRSFFRVAARHAYQPPQDASTRQPQEAAT